MSTVFIVGDTPDSKGKPEIELKPVQFLVNATGGFVPPDKDKDKDKDKS